MEISNLYKIAEQQGVTVDFLTLKEVPAFSMELDGREYIALAKELGTADERVCLAHELGHISTGALYPPDADPGLRKANERSADRWAIELLVPFADLLCAMKRGDEELSALADRFSVTEDFMQKAIKHYCEKRRDEGK